jgi:hypothetical protein
MEERRITRAKSRVRLLRSSHREDLLLRDLHIVNLARVLFIGIVAWAVALVVTLVMVLSGGAEWPAVAVCGAGIVLGVAGVFWARRHKN